MHTCAHVYTYARAHTLLCTQNLNPIPLGPIPAPHQTHTTHQPERTSRIGHTSQERERARDRDRNRDRETETHTETAHRDRDRDRDDHRDRD